MPYPLQQSLKIATLELRSCYTPRGIVAGRHHFTDYWARDGYFAALGSLALSDNKVVTNMVNLFYKYQRSDGLIPYRIMGGPTTLGKYFGYPSFYKSLYPSYCLREIGSVVLDGTTLTLLFTAILGLKKLINPEKYTAHIRSSLSFLESREKNHLLYDGVMAEWNDAVWKFGNLLYSNIIYWYMYDRLEKLFVKLDPVFHKKLNLKKIAISEALRKKLWTGKFFADWYDIKRHDQFYPFGNCLAVAWGLTNKTESESILNECQKASFGFTLETNIPKYPRFLIDPFQRLVGMKDYHNQGILWWQTQASHLLALKKTGNKRGVKKIVKLITEKISRDKKIYECYERDGRPVNRLLYKSEYPFAWSSGMLLYALSQPS